MEPLTHWAPKHLRIPHVMMVTLFRAWTRWGLGVRQDSMYNLYLYWKDNQIDMAEEEEIK